MLHGQKAVGVYSYFYIQFNSNNGKLAFFNFLIKPFLVNRVPYSALASTLGSIEEVSARLKMIEILSNFFRSVMVLTPEDMLPSVYLCLNKIAPAYEGHYYLCGF